MGPLPTLGLAGMQIMATLCHTCTRGVLPVWHCTLLKEGTEYTPWDDTPFHQNHLFKRCSLLPVGVLSANQRELSKMPTCLSDHLAELRTACGLPGNGAPGLSALCYA